MMSSVNLEDLSLQEEEGFVFDVEEGDEEVVDFRWCLVGRFLGDRSIHVNSMKVTMADVWRPVKGVKIKEATPGLFLFQFAHALDMEAVLQGGPWSFNNQMLIMERVRIGVQIENIPLYHVDFWVQVHNLPTGLMAERVGKTLGNYIGSFVEYDKNNKGSFWREYMRIKVRLDIRQPLKKESRVKNQGGDWCTVHFKYEKLGVFCFVCGMIGHGENRCAVRFSMVDDDGSRAWSKELRAEPRRRGGRQTSKWLLDDEGGRSAVQVDSPSSVTGDEQRDPTVSNIPLFSPNHNRQGINSQSLVCSPHVPTASTNKHDLAHLIINQPIIGPIITAHTETLTNQQSSINQEIVQPSTIIPQPPQSINTQDKTLMDHSLPNNTKPSTSLIFSSILTDTLKQKPNHQFSFTASNSSNINQAINPINRTIKINPTQKLNRTTLTRTGTKPVPPKPVPTLHQNSPVSMEVQTEKKRRRDEEKESIDNSAATQHFLMAGPGSQACQDQ
jgi:14-3-3 protein epsilon